MLRAGGAARRLCLLEVGFLRLGDFLALLLDIDARLIHTADGILADEVNHLVEHVIAFNLIFGDGVLVAVSAQADAVAQLIHRVDVIHPAAIHAGEEHDALQLTRIDMDQLEALLAQGVEIARFLLELGDQFILVDGLESFLMRLEEADADAQTLQILRQALKVPIGVIVAVAAVGRNRFLDELVRHLDDGFVHVAALEHLLALLVDFLALLIHHVVILKHVLTDFVVARFNTLLGVLNLPGEHLRFDRLVLSQTHFLDQAADALTAEQAHQIILHGEEELGGAGVALTARAAAQLVVNTAGLVALRADDVQASDGNHAVMLRVRLLFELGIELLVNHARGEHFFADVLVEAGRFLDHIVLVTLLLHRAAGEELRVAAQQDIRAAARHVRGDGDRAEVAGLRDNLCLAGVILRVQHDVLDAAHAQHLGEHFADLDGNRADQNRLTRLVAALNLLNDLAELALLRAVDQVVHILADHRTVGRNLHHVELVNALEFFFLRLGRAGHAGELAVHAEIILEGDGGQRLALTLHLHVFLRLDGLMQTVAVTAADHQTAGEFVNDDNFIVLHDVIHVALHQGVRAQRGVNVMQQLVVGNIGKVLHAEPALGLAHARFGEVAGLFLFVDDVILAHRGKFFVGKRIFLPAILLRFFALLQGADEAIRLFIQVGGLVARAGDNQRRARFVDEDGVHLVHDGEVMTALHHVLLIDHHVVAQIVKAHLVVRAVGHVAGISRLALFLRQIMHDHAHSHAEEAENAAHVFALELSQIVVDGDDMHALARERVEIRRHGRRQGLALAGLHLGDAALMEHDAAEHLHAELALARHAAGRFAHDGIRFRQQVVQRFAVFEPLTEFDGLAAQLLVGQRLVRFFKRIDLIDNFVQAFDLPGGRVE